MYPRGVIKTRGILEESSARGYISVVMDDFQTMSRAAGLAGVDRKSISRWVKAGLLKSKREQVRNLTATLVSVKAVRELAKERRPGRPSKKG